MHYFTRLGEQLREIADENDAISILKKLLADEYVLYAKLRNYHWNVTGPFFNDLHKFFENNYIMTEEIVDQVAERIRALGEKSPGTLSEFLQTTRIKEPVSQELRDTDMLQDLYSNYTQLISILRKNIEDLEPADPVTANFLQELTFKHEKTNWILRSLLQKG